MEYKKRFKEQIEVLEAYNGEVLFRNSPGATAREIEQLGLDAESADDVCFEDFYLLLEYFFILQIS